MYYRSLVQSLASRRDAPVKFPAERLDERKAFLCKRTQLHRLLPRRFFKQGALLVREDMQHIARNPVEKHRVVPFVRGINIPHILEAGKVAHFTRRQEGVSAEIAGHKGKSIESDGVELRIVGGCLLDGVLLRSARFPVCGMALVVATLRAVAHLAFWRRLVSVASRLSWGWVEVTQLVWIKTSVCDHLVHRWTARETGLLKSRVNGFCLFSRERAWVVFGEDYLDLLGLLIGECLDFFSITGRAFAASGLLCGCVER